MHAVVLSEFGDASGLRLAETGDPVPRAGWTTVRLRASALNWHDVLVRQGRYDSPLPHILGADGAGTTDAGDEVVILPSLWWGDAEHSPAEGWEILGDRRPGTYAEYVSAPTENLFAKPRGLSWAEAAALPLVGVTAYRALIGRGRLVAGESLLVLGASGGLATTAVALAAGIGANVVVTSSAPEHIDQAVANGAAAGVLYSDADWPDAARRLSPGGRGFDLVLDSVGTWQSSLRALRPGGRLVVLGASRAESANLDVRSFYFGQYELIGTTMGSPRDFAGLLELVEAGTMPAPLIDRVFPLAEAAAAHEYLETGSGFGKIVLSTH